ASSWRSWGLRGSGEVAPSALPGESVARRALPPGVDGAVTLASGIADHGDPNPEDLRSDNDAGAEGSASDEAQRGSAEAKRRPCRAMGAAEAKRRPCRAMGAADAKRRPCRARGAAQPCLASRSAW